MAIITCYYVIHLVCCRLDDVSQVTNNHALTYVNSLVKYQKQTYLWIKRKLKAMVPFHKMHRYRNNNAYYRACFTNRK